MANPQNQKNQQKQFPLPQNPLNSKVQDGGNGDDEIPVDKLFPFEKDIIQDISKDEYQEYVLNSPKSIEVFDDPTKYFDLIHLHKLYSDAEKIDTIIETKSGKKVVTMLNLVECKKYIDSFFIILDNDCTVFRKNEKWIINKSKTFKSIIYRFPTELIIWFNKEKIDIKTLTDDITLPKMGKKFFNTFGGFLHQRKPFTSFSEEIKQKVNIFNKYLFEVLANSDQLVYEAIIKWYAKIAQGQKNDTCLVLKGVGRIGKSLGYYQCNTNNHQAIRDEQNERYSVLDVSTKYRNDRNYFGTLHNACFNLEVGEAYFNFLCEVDVTKFKAQNDFPTTQRKLESIASCMSNELKFLKDTIILPKTTYIGKPIEFYHRYVEYSLSKGKKAFDKNNFYQFLRDHNLKPYGCNGYDKYKILYNELYATFKENNWINDIDLRDYNDLNSEDNNKSDDLDFGLPNNSIGTQSESPNDLLDQIEQQKVIIEDLQANIQKSLQIQQYLLN
jgi:hypothetical protein